MPSMAKPMHSVPETKPSDVKQKASSQEPSAEKEIAAAQAAQQTTTATKEASVELDEQDLKSLEEEQKIPYSRFKEKNEESKRLKAELESAEKRYREDLARAVAEKEALASLRAKQEESDIYNVADPMERELKQTRSEMEELKREIHSLKGQTKEDRLRSQLSELQSKYPEADQLAVMGWAKQTARADIEELMELSHTRNVERAEKKIKELLEKKKTKAKQALPVSDATGFRLKDGEKPKSVREANSLLKRFLS